MSTQRHELERLVRQLRAELEWASRTGIEVVVQVPASPDALAIPPNPDPLPVEAGRPIGIEAARPPEDTTDDEPPPAFEPDPQDEPEVTPVAASVPPSQIRRRSAPNGRPWESYLPPASTPASEAARPEPTARSRPPEAGPPPAPASRPRPGPDDALARARSLGEVREILGDCTRCKLHRAGRRQIVFGVGNPNAELMFVGEGPGRQEDLQGEPFVGDAGQLLTRIIEKGMGVRRSEVYIANIVKCRPPGNRDPEPDEVEACEPFLRAQIQQIEPRVIVALGKYAAQTLLRSSTPISRLRGRFHRYEGIDLMPTYHPAYLLRNPAEKRPVWEDMQAVMQKLGWRPPQR